MPARPRSGPAIPRPVPVDRRTFPLALGIAFAIALAGSLHVAEVDPRRLLDSGAAANVARFARGSLPPRLTPDFLALLWQPALETIQISVAGTAIAVLLGLPLGLVATASLSWTGILNARRGRAARWVTGFVPYALARALLSAFRAIPEYVWALVFVRAVGLGAFPGVLAIGVAYAGMLGKVYSETLESVDPRPLESLQAAGASRAGVVLYGLLPQAAPGLVSYTLYRWECAIRASAVLGFVGAGGLGQQIELSMRMFQFDEVLTLLGALFLLVAVVDLVSARLRAWIVGR